MKPNKSKVYCRDAGRSKILFETEKKAMNFIKFNAEDIKAASGFCPTRAYFCIPCGGYHVTSNNAASYFESKDRLMAQAYDTYTQDKHKQLEAHAARMDLQMLEAKRLKMNRGY
jgi:hypothetical protein